jgi:hypothetical protein
MDWEDLLAMLEGEVNIWDYEMVDVNNNPINDEY